LCWSVSNFEKPRGFHLVDKTCTDSRQTFESIEHYVCIRIHFHERKRQIAVDDRSNEKPKVVLGQATSRMSRPWATNVPSATLINALHDFLQFLFIIFMKFCSKKIEWNIHILARCRRCFKVS